MAASHHHQQNHHMNSVNRPPATSSNIACGMLEEEEEDDLAALRIAALKNLEERRLKKEPRALIVQRNNVLVIEPQDHVGDFRQSPPSQRFARDPSLSPIAHRRRSRESSPNLRKISPPSSRWSPRSNSHRRSPSPYHMNGGHHSPSHHSWNPSKRRPSPRAHSPRRLSHSPRRRSPIRRRTPPLGRRSPHRTPLSPSRRSPRKSPQRSPGRRCSPQRSPPTKRSPRKSPVRGSPRRFSPRRRPRDSSDSRSGKSLRRNGEKRKASPVQASSSSAPSASARRRTGSPLRRKEPSAHPADQEQATESAPAASSKKGRFERFEDSAASDDESCNESLLDELFRETEETTARTEAVEAETLDEESQEIPDTVTSPTDNKVEDEDCLLLQADDDLDDLFVDCSASETAVPVSSDRVNPPRDHSAEKRRNEQEKVFKERDHDEKNRSRGRHSDHRNESSTDVSPRSRHTRNERTARMEKKENRERRSKVTRDDYKATNDSEKRKRSRSRDKDRSKRKPIRKTSPKPERHTSESKSEIRPQSLDSKTRAHVSPEKSISVEDRERLEARKKKFLQKELKPSQKVISLKKSPTSRSEDADDTRRLQDRLGDPVKEPKLSSPRSDDMSDTSSKPTILSRLGPPPSSKASVKDRIGHLNTNSSSPTRTPQTMTDAAQVKFEVRNRPTLDPKLKIHINLGGTLSTGSSTGSSKSKKVVCLE